MFVVTIYDVSDDKRRSHLHKKLKNYTEPVQFSAFEGHLRPKQLEQMKTTILRIIKKSEDRVRIYFLCDDCKKRTEIFGEGRITDDMENVNVFI